MANTYPFANNTPLAAADLNAAIAGIDTPVYNRVTPTTGGSITLGADDRTLIIDPASSLATLTVTMPTGVDKRRIRIATRQRLDALTINGSGGASVDWAADELPASGALEFVYVSGINTWVRV